MHRKTIGTALWILAMINIKPVSCLTIFEKKFIAIDAKGTPAHDRGLLSVNLSDATFQDPNTSVLDQTISAHHTDLVTSEPWKEFQTTDSPDTSTLKGDADSQDKTSTDISSSPEPDWSTMIFTTPQFTADKPLETARKAPLFF